MFLRFSTLIGQIGRVPLFGAGPRRYQVAAIQVGRHRFRACPYRFLAATRQAKAGLSSDHSHYRTAFESFAPDISEQPDQDLTDLFDTRNHGSQRLSAKLPTHTARGCHTHARTYNARQVNKSPASPATPSHTAKHTHSIVRMATSQLKVGTLSRYAPTQATCVR